MATEPADDVRTMSMEAIRARLEHAAPDSFIEALRQDPRAGARRLAESYARRRAREQKESARLERLFAEERALHARGLRAVGGVDEAGRGPLAGPVVAGCVILPDEPRLFAGLDDSKKLTPEKRDRLDAVIRREAMAFGLGLADAQRIDEVNIYRATQEAMRMAIEACSPVRPDFVLVDGTPLRDSPLPQRAIVQGDAIAACISAGSVLAKVHRDRLMAEYDVQYPEYGFRHHKGYGTEEHLAALARFGTSPIHRTSFEPVRQYVLPSATVLTTWIERARTPEALRVVGERIRNAREFLTEDELQTLRAAYRERRDRLGRTAGAEEPWP